MLYPIIDLNVLVSIHSRTMAGGYNGYNMYANLNKNGSKLSANLAIEYNDLDELEQQRYKTLALTKTAEPLTLAKRKDRIKEMKRKIESILDEAHDLDISSSLTLRFAFPTEDEEIPMQLTTFCTLK